MAGQLALAGLVPDRTPLDEWVAAAFAVLITSPVDGKSLDKAYDALTRPLPVEHRTDIDRDTWGLTDAALAAQDQLLGNAGLDLAAVLAARDGSTAADVRDDENPVEG